MSMKSLPLMAALALLFLAAKPTLACLYPSPGVSPVGLFRAPDSSLPPPVVASGADLLAIEQCSDSMCSSTGVTMRLQIVDSRGAERAVHLDPLPQSQMGAMRYWRVHPELPLPEGKYTFKTFYQYPSAFADSPVEASFPFEISGMAVDTTAAMFDLDHPSSVLEHWYAIGKGFACKPIDTSCGPQTSISTTQEKRRLLITAYAMQVPASELGQFMYRLVPKGTGLSDLSAAELWVPDGFFSAEGVLMVDFREALPEYCVELQAVRVRDLQLQTVAEHCTPYKLRVEPEPAPFTPCQADPTEYIRAYCFDNAPVCSSANLAKSPEIAADCDKYPLLCAPFIGNRSPSDRPGCGMP